MKQCNYKETIELLLTYTISAAQQHDFDTAGIIDMTDCSTDWKQRFFVIRSNQNKLIIVMEIGRHPISCINIFDCGATTLLVVINIINVRLMRQHRWPGIWQLLKGDKACLQQNSCKTVLWLGHPHCCSVCRCVLTFIGKASVRLGETGIHYCTPFFSCTVCASAHTSHLNSTWGWNTE